MLLSRLFDWRDALVAVRRQKLGQLFHRSASEDVLWTSAR
jgi:hypothetical protein